MAPIDDVCSSPACSRAADRPRSTAAGVGVATRAGACARRAARLRRPIPGARAAGAAGDCACDRRVGATRLSCDRPSGAADARPRAAAESGWTGARRRRHLGPVERSPPRLDRDVACAAPTTADAVQPAPAAPGRVGGNLDVRRQRRTRRVNMYFGHRRGSSCRRPGTSAGSTGSPVARSLARRRRRAPAASSTSRPRRRATTRRRAAPGRPAWRSRASTQAHRSRHGRHVVLSRAPARCRSDASPAADGAPRALGPVAPRIHHRLRRHAADGRAARRGLRCTPPGGPACRCGSGRARAAQRACAVLLRPAARRVTARAVRRRATASRPADRRLAERARCGHAQLRAPVSDARARPSRRARVEVGARDARERALDAPRASRTRRPARACAAGA